jgi:hypothetical protein
MLSRRGTLWTFRGLWRAGRGEDPEPDFARAEDDLGKAIELGAALPYPWFRRGMLRDERGQWLARGRRAPVAVWAAEAMVERGRLLVGR